MRVRLGNIADDHVRKVLPKAPSAATRGVLGCTAVSVFQALDRKPSLVKAVQAKGSASKEKGWGVGVGGGGWGFPNPAELPVWGAGENLGTPHGCWAHRGGVRVGNCIFDGGIFVWRKYCRTFVTRVLSGVVCYGLFQVRKSTPI